MCNSSETEREELLNSLRKYNTFLSILNRIDSMVIRATDEEYVIKAVCEELSKWKDFKNIRIFLKKENDMEPFPYCPPEYERKIKEVIQNWSGERSVKVNGKDMVILPMRFQDRILGFFLAETGGMLEREELDFLQVLLDDVAFAINALRLDRARKIAYHGIERVIEEFTLLIDGIRNPLAVISGIAELETPEKVKERILKEVEKIDAITRKIDEIWMGAEHLRNILREW